MNVFSTCSYLQIRFVPSCHQSIKNSGSAVSTWTWVWYVTSYLPPVALFFCTASLLSRLHRVYALLFYFSSAFCRQPWPSLFSFHVDLSFFIFVFRTLHCRKALLCQVTINPGSRSCQPHLLVYCSQTKQIWTPLMILLWGLSGPLTGIYAEVHLM